MLGTYASSSGYYDAYYKQALATRAHLIKEYRQVFEQVDALVSPTSPIPAFKLGEKVDDPLQLYLADIFTVGVNITGIPAISVPCGISGSLPVGLQIMAPHFREDTLFQIASVYEASTNWHKLRPPVW